MTGGEEQWAWFGYVNHCNEEGGLSRNRLSAVGKHLWCLHPPSPAKERINMCEMEGERDLVKSDSMRRICSGKYSEKVIKFIESRCALVETRIMASERLCFRVIKNEIRE